MDLHLESEKLNINIHRRPRELRDRIKSILQIFRRLSYSRLRLMLSIFIV